MKNLEIPYLSKDPKYQIRLGQLIIYIDDTFFEPRACIIVNDNEEPIDGYVFSENSKYEWLGFPISSYPCVTVRYG